MFSFGAHGRNSSAEILSDFSDFCVASAPGKNPLARRTAPRAPPRPLPGCGRKAGYLHLLQGLARPLSMWPPASLLWFSLPTPRRHPGPGTRRFSPGSLLLAAFRAGSPAEDETLTVVSLLSCSCWKLR